MGGEGRWPGIQPKIINRKMRTQNQQTTNVGWDCI